MRSLVTSLLVGMVLILSGCAGSADSGVSVKELRCEYRINPQGIDVVEPRLSWILESSQRGQMQIAYQVLVAGSEEKLKKNEGELWDTGKVNSDESIHVVYAGKNLKSRMRCWWKVRVWDKDGRVSAWSEPRLFVQLEIEYADGSRQTVVTDKSWKASYGTVISRDLKNWEDISDKVRFPKGIRHGTVFQVSKAILTKLP